MKHLTKTTGQNTRSMVNGQVDDSVLIQDRGYQYGDGLFETLAVFDGEIKYWPLHWARLCEGCDRLFLPRPNESEILSEIGSLMAGVGKEIVKLIISRGQGRRGYAFDQMKPTRVVSVHEWPAFAVELTTKGISLFVCETNIAIQPALAGIKHLNRLENVLARHEWQDRKYAEGVMLDMNGNVIEGTMSNIFLVKDHILQTPDLSQCGVAGITRQRIMSAAVEKGITLEVKKITLVQLEAADEVFVCNTVIGIWPVCKIRQKEYHIGKAHNPVTQLIQDAAF